MKILIVDDSASNALILRRLVERLGHDAVLARDGIEAWQALEDRSISLVISDWVMPRMDGLELCRRIRARRDSRYVYFILLTVKCDRSDRLQGLRAGADDFLVKPPDPEELFSRLEIARRLMAMQDELERKNQLLAELATTDELTGLKNRRRFREDLELQFQIAIRQSIPLSVVMLDVDRFKSLNDEFGHPAGDLVLKGVADILKAGLRGQDTPARYGGEEFVLLLPGTEGRNATIVAERLRGSLSRVEPSPRPITASFGVAELHRQHRSPDDLVAEADRALYVAKQQGRDRVVFAHDLRTELGQEPTPENAPSWSSIVGC
jgi:two-component system chemotaxis response regulator CheY